MSSWGTACLVLGAINIGYDVVARKGVKATLADSFAMLPGFSQYAFETGTVATGIGGATETFSVAAADAGYTAAQISGVSHAVNGSIMTASLALDIKSK